MVFNSGPEAPSGSVELPQGSGVVTYHPSDQIRRSVSLVFVSRINNFWNKRFKS